MPYIGIYLGIISLISIIVTVHDKIAARRNRQRVREWTLIHYALLGGATAMLLTMLTIRHKTRHLKFMIGLPIIILIQIAAVLLYFYITRLH